MSKEIEPLAHSANGSGHSEPLLEHLKAVAERTSKYAAIFGAGEEARFAGLLRDLGNYGDLFQRRLRGEVGGIDPDRLSPSENVRAILRRYDGDGHDCEPAMGELP